LVRPEILRSYITENYLGRIDATLLRPYLAQRSDWGQFEKGFNDGAEVGAEDGGGTEGKGLRERFGVGRLSVMMKELEGLKLAEGLTIGLPTLPSMPAGLPGGFSM